MEDTFSKYLRLFGSILLGFIGLIVFLVLLMLGIRVFFGLLSYVPFITYIYTIFILLLPAALFTTIWIIYMRRTVSHPSKPIRILSYTIFGLFLAAWAVFFVLDAIVFFKYFYPQIDKYYSYNLLFLVANVASLFLVGVVQALTTEKEKDWMERRG